METQEALMLNIGIVKNMTKKSYIKPSGSDPGTEWGSIVKSAVSSFFCVATDDMGNWVALTDSGTGQYSDDNGDTWTEVTLPVTHSFDSIAYGDGVYVAVGADSADDNTIYSNDKGRTWNVATIPVGLGWTAIAFGNHTFVACAVNGDATNKVMKSSDGAKTWNSIAVPANLQLFTCAFGDGVFIITAGNGDLTNSVWRSTDNGSTWVKITVSYIRPSSFPYSYMTFGVDSKGNKTFVSMAYGGSATNQIAVSRDKGLTWTFKDAPVAQEWTGGVYGEGVFVFIGEDISKTPMIITSFDDGNTWIGRDVPNIQHWTAIGFGNRKFLAVSYDGDVTKNIMISPFDRNVKFYKNV